jgi:hypothetical protein
MRKKDEKSAEILNAQNRKEEIWRNDARMNKPGRPVDQRIRAMLAELGIKFTDQSLGETFYSMIRANDEIGRQKVVANRRTMDRTIIGVVVI